MPAPLPPARVDAVRLDAVRLDAVPTSPAGRVRAVLLFVQLCFGGFHVVAKALLATVSPLALAGLRVGAGTPVLLLLAWQHDRVIPGRRHWGPLLLLGLLGVCANQLLFIVGLRSTTATNAAILMPSIPVFTAAIAALFRIERIDRRRLVGILLAVSGALVLLDPSRFALYGPTADATTRGNLMVLANCLAYAGFLVLQRPVLRELPWRTVIAWSFLAGTLGVAPLAWRDTVAFLTAPHPTTTWLGVGYVLIFPTILAYALNTWAVRRSSPAEVAAYTTLQPVIAALLAAAFLGERLGWRQGLGFVGIVAGLLLVSVGRRRAVSGAG